MPNGTSVQFKRGLLANMPSQAVDGTIYVTTDEHAMYLDNGNQRIRIGDFIPVNTVNDLPAAGHVYETAMYYVKTGNILARWDKTNSRWIQINKAGVVGITNTSDGNVVTGVAMAQDPNDGTLRLVISRANVATTEDFDSLLDRIADAEDNIEDLEENVSLWASDVNTSGSILNLIEVAKNALLGGATTYTTLNAIEDAIIDMAGDLTTLSETVDDISDDVTDHEARISANERAITTLNGDANTQGSVASKVSAAVTALINNAPASFDTLKEIADWIQTHGAEAGNLITRLGEAEDAIDSLQDAVGDNTTDITNLKTRMTTAEGDIDDLQADINLLKGSDSTAGSVAYQIKQQVTIINEHIDDVDDKASLALEHLTWQEFPIINNNENNGENDNP